LLLGLVGMTPAFVSGTAAPGELAVSLGGMMLVYWGLRRLSDAGPTTAAAALAWRRTRRFFDAAAAHLEPPRAVVATGTDEAAAGTRGLLVARDVAFHYRGRPEPALRGCNFAIQRGDRILLQGGSGSGKSTLSGLITGLREPTSGALMLGGFDHHTLGPARWRERAGGVPQFHENHVLSASLVFNMAMGRAWPPTPEDWKEIQAVCHELGLDGLLQRMPAGLQQMVGDSGWQLSHGEASRLFVARSLLQDLDLRVLDESFAALDPVTFETVLDCVLRRSRTLVVVAHL
jgi:ATP-binding cassette subfamily B protein